MSRVVDRDLSLQVAGALRRCAQRARQGLSRGARARDKSGAIVEPCSEKAVAWDAIGLIQREAQAPHLQRHVYDALRRTAALRDGETVAEWSDRSTSSTGVALAFDVAASNVEEGR